MLAKIFEKNANKRKQTQTNANKCKQPQTNANKRKQTYFTNRKHILLK